MDTLLEMSSSNMKKKSFDSQFAMCVMEFEAWAAWLNKQVSPVQWRRSRWWTESDQTRKGGKKMLCWFLKFIRSVVIKDNAREHKLWKSLHDGGSLTWCSSIILKHRHIFLVYFKTAMWKVKNKTKQMDRRDSRGAKIGHFSQWSASFFLVDGSCVCVCACTMSSPYST